MSEPAGLNMSLDDIIKKKYQGPDQRHGGGRGGGRGGQGNLGIRVGGVQKPQAPAQAKFVQHNGQQQGGYQHHGGYSQQGGFQQQQGRGSYQQGGRGGRGGFGGQQGQGGQFSQHRGRGFNQQQQQQQQGGYQRGSTGQQQQHHNQQAGYTQQPAPPPRLPCRTFLRQETGDVVVQLKDTEVRNAA